MIVDAEPEVRVIALTPLDVGLSRRDVIDAIRICLLGMEAGASLDDTLDHLKQYWLGKK